MELKSNQKMVDKSHDLCATIISMGMSRQASHSCSSKVSQLAKIDHFSPQAFFTASPSTMKVPQSV